VNYQVENCFEVISFIEYLITKKNKDDRVYEPVFSSNEKKKSTIIEVILV